MGAGPRTRWIAHSWRNRQRDVPVRRVDELHRLRTAAAEGGEVPAQLITSANTALLSHWRLGMNNLKDERESAHYLGGSQNCLRKWRSSHCGPKYHRLGYTQEDLEVWLGCRVRPDNNPVAQERSIDHA